jgi:hypothetical protein
MGLIDLSRCFVRIIFEYNAFNTNSTNESIIPIQRWSTRLYILVLWLAMKVLIIYTIYIFLQSTYFNLYNQYKNIKCPCTQVSISYKEFVELSPSYNQICSSEFVSDQ